MLKKFIRLIFTMLGAVAGFGAFKLTEFIIEKAGRTWEDLGFAENVSRLPLMLAFMIIFAIIFFFIMPLLRRQGSKMATDIESDLQSVPPEQVFASTAGLLIGLLIAYLISGIYHGIEMTGLNILLTIVTYLVCAYLGLTIGSQKGREFLPMLLGSLRGGAGGKGKYKNASATPKIIDTSVIIDGRISDIMKTGFIEGPIVIPEFVLVELRHIADSSDALKRNRGRRGLDILNKIQTEYGIEIYNTNSERALDEIPEVDVKLLKLAQIMNGKVVTNDYNLNKVAGINGVSVLNINELANTLKPVVLPGEAMNVFLVKEGKEYNQAVAYLDDGTMIVVEEGRKYIGKSTDVMVTSVLQTAAGRMIFAKPK